jgi:predicted nucleotidyltransferase
MIDEFIIQNLSEIREVCRKNNVERLYVFGSIVDGRFVKGSSDIDMMVEFNKTLYTKKENSRSLVRLWIQLQTILNTKVDLITSENIEEEYFKKYLRLYKEIVYERNTTASN